MENSTGFEVKFSRTVQAAQYEPATAEIKAVFASDKSDVSIAESKLRECREAVERVLGLKPAAVLTGGNDRVPVASAPMAKDTPVAAKTDPGNGEDKKKRGRPTLEEAAKKAAALALARADNDPMAEIISEADPTEAQNISTGEDRNDPMADVLGDDISEVVEQAIAEEKPITDQELQNTAGKAVQRLGDANIIRKMVKQNYKVARLDEVPPQLRRALVNDLSNLQKDGSIKAPEKK